MNFENLPNTWKVVRLGRVAEIHQGKTPQRSEYLDQGGCKILKVRDINEDGTINWNIEEKGFISEELARSYENCKIKIGDILFTSSAHSPEHIGKKVAIVKSIPSQFKDVYHVAELIRVRAYTNQLNPLFLFYLLSSPEGYTLIQDQIQGVHVYPKDLSNLPIPLPPLPEQKRIVEILTLAEELIRKQKEAIALIDKILMAKFLEMFGDPATNPKGWEVRRLGEVATTTTGGTPLRKIKEYWENGTIPWIKSGELNDSFIYDSEEKITPRGLENSNAKIYPEGTLLIAMYGATAGKLGILKVEASTNQAVCAIFPSKDHLEKWYLWFYFLKTRDILLNQRFGGAQPNLSQDFICSIRLPLPPIQLQKQFAQIVEEFEKKREEMQKTLGTLESLFKLFQKKAFTGELTAKWREQNKIEWELPKITKRQAILLACLYYYQNLVQKPAMVTVAMKSAFLLQQEAGLNLGYNFIPYKYGPFSKEVYEDLEELEKNLLVERIKPKKDLEMTEIKLIDEFKDWAERIINNLPQKIKDEIKTYTEKYGKMNLNELLDYVYAEYPEYAIKSKRKERKK